MKHKYRRTLSQATIDWLCNENDRDCDCFVRLANEQEIAAALHGDLFGFVEPSEGSFVASADGVHVAHHRVTGTKIYFGKKDWSKKIL